MCVLLVVHAWPACFAQRGFFFRTGNCSSSQTYFLNLFVWKNCLSARNFALIKYLSSNKFHPFLVPVRQNLHLFICFFGKISKSVRQQNKYSTISGFGLAGRRRRRGKQVLSFHLCIEIFSPEAKQQVENFSSHFFLFRGEVERLFGS